MATKKKAEEKPDHESVVISEQFFNTNDWPLFRPKALYRVKPYDEGFVVVDQKGAVQFVTQEELSADFEPVKGPHKGEF